MFATLLGLTNSSPRLHPLLRSQRTASSASMRGWTGWPFPPAPSSSSGRDSGLPPEPLVQRIYRLASAGDLDGVQAAMEELTPQSLAFEVPAPAPARPPEAGSPHVSYVHVWSGAAFSMGVFLLPAGASIPLHDHPGMSVLSKLLYGSLRVTSYDLGQLSPDAAASADVTSRKLGGPLLGRRRGARRMRCAPPRTSVVSAPAPAMRLDAVRGNLHEFLALADTAVFDVLLPPYSDAAGRPCHYYAPARGGAGGEGAGEGAGALVDLEEVPWPDSLVVDSAPYRGPKCGPGA